MFKNLFLIILLSFNLSAHAETTLSLDDAINLAIRSNPNVKSSRLSHVLQKFNLHVQKWQFYPHYTFQASATLSQKTNNGNPMAGSHSYGVQPGISLTTPIGTNIALSGTNAKIGYYNPGLTLQVTQPLMRGFGKAIVESALENAKDSEYIARLNIEGTIRSTVTAVINAYLDILTADRTIEIDDEALSRAKKSVEQTKLFIKAGRKAKNEIVTVLADVASAKSKLEDDKNNLLQAKNALLTAIGLDPNASIKFSSLDVTKLIKKYQLPSLERVKSLILKNDIQYQTDIITIHGSTKRNLMIAKDNERWLLNLTATVGTGNGAGGGFNAGINSLFNGANQTQSVGLQLTIPINDQTLKQSVLNAKVALEQAQIALLKEKWSKETSAINGWNSVLSAKRAVRYAEDAAQLQKQTYHLSYKKYLHGLIDSLELQSAQFRLIGSEESLLRARISYLKSLVTMDELIGHTLKTWNIEARFK